MDFLNEILGSLWETLSKAALLAPAALISMTVHELSHGLAAYAMGDTTAKNEGRLTLNPLKHIDIVGTLALIFFRFGWAKPVHVDPRAFKNPKQGMALTALAGPVSNFVLAFLMITIWALLPVSEQLYSNQVFVYFSSLLLYTAMLSVGLGVFNLIPIPPLDGSKVLFSLLPDNLYMRLLSVERYGFVLVILLCVSGVFSNVLTTSVSRVLNLMVSIYGIPYIF